MSTIRYRSGEDRLKFRDAPDRSLPKTGKLERDSETKSNFWYNSLVLTKDLYRSGTLPAAVRTGAKALGDGQGLGGQPIRGGAYATAYVALSENREIFTC